MQMLLQFISGKGLSRAFVVLAPWWYQSLELSCCGLRLYTISLAPLSSQGLPFTHLTSGSQALTLGCLGGASVIVGGSSLFSFECLMYASSTAALQPGCILSY